MPQKLTVLVVEDALVDQTGPVDPFLVFLEIDDPDFQIESAGSLEAAIALLEEGGFEAVLLNLSRPTTARLKILKTLIKHARSAPIIVLTDVVDEAFEIAALKSGAQDCLVKGGAWRPVLNRILRYAIQRQQLVSALASREHDLKLAEARFQDFAAAASDWYWEMGPDLRFTWLSERWDEVTHVPRDRILGKTRAELVTRDVPQEIWTRHIADLNAHRPFRDFRYPLDTSTGATTWISVSGVPVIDKHGVFRGYRGTGTNITAQVLAEERAARNRKLLEDAIESITDGFALFDSDDHLVLCNNNYRNALSDVADLLRPGVPWGILFRERVKHGRHVVPEHQSKKEWIREQIRSHRRGQGTRHQTTHDGRFIELHEYRTHDGGRVIIRADVTESRRAEDALRASENQLQNLTRSTHDAIITINANSAIISWNPAAENMFGYTEAEALGAPLTTMLPEPFRAAHEQGVRRFLSGDGGGRAIGKTAELLALRKDGTEFPVELSLSTWISNGERYFAGFIRDITRRKRAEDRLRKLSRAVEQSPATVVITNTQGEIEYVNPRFEELTGYLAEEVLNKNPRLLKSGRTSSEEYASLWQTISSGGQWQGEFQNRKKNGELFWESATIGPISAPDGTITHFLAIKEDITARKAADQKLGQALREQAALNQLLAISQHNLPLHDKLTELLRVTLDVARIGLRPQGAVFMAHEGAQTLQLETEINLRPEIYKTCQSVRFGTCLRGRAAAGGKIVFADCVDDRHDSRPPGSIPHCHYILPLTWNEKLLGALVVYVDAGHKLKADEEDFLKAVANVIALTIDRDRATQQLLSHRDHLQAEVEAATREIHSKAVELENALAKERELNILQRQFVSMASHEFRTPLAIIDGSAQRIARRHGNMSADDLGERIGKIRGAVQRMGDLITSTLSAASLDAGKVSVSLQGCNLRALVQASCARHRDIAKRHNISVDVADLPSEVYADPGAVDQIVTNLLSNATKYAPNAPDIKVRGWTDGEMAVVAVSDSGIGIPADEIPRMFERFFRARTSTGIPGTGIGLNLVAHLVDLHGGTIGVTSVEGEGSTFTVRIPINPLRPAKSSTLISAR